MGQQYIISKYNEKLEYPSEFISPVQEKIIGRFIANQQDGIFIYERTLSDEASIRNFFKDVKKIVWKLYKEYQIGETNERIS